MSRELQEKADRMIKELEDALVPLKEEINNQKIMQRDNILTERSR
jgi:hypothetical protein